MTSINFDSSKNKRFIFMYLFETFTAEAVTNLQVAMLYLLISHFPWTQKPEKLSAHGMDIPG